MSHAKSCPCKTCKSAKPPLWWIDFTAEKQVIVKDGISETFEATEARAVRAFAEGIQADIDKVIEEVSRKLSASIRAGDTWCCRECDVWNKCSCDIDSHDSLECDHFVCYCR